MASERLKVLTDLRNKALADARVVVEEAEAAGRTILDEAEEQRVQSFLSDHDKMQNAIDEEVALSEREAAGAESRNQFITPEAPAAPKGPSLEEWMLRAVQGTGEYTCEVALTADQAGTLKPEVRSFIGEREYRTDYPLTSADAGTTYSSYAVPAEVAPYIEDLKYAYSGVLQAGVNAMTTDGINTLYIPKTSTAPTINMAGAPASFENTAPTNSSYPVLGRTTLGGYRCDAFAVITEEDIMSSAVDMMGYLNKTLAGALAAKVAAYLIIGTGSNQPAGLQVAATTGKTAASTSTFTGDEVIEAYQSIAAQYRPGLRAVISQTGETILMKAKNGEGDYIWRSGLAAGNPDSVLGVPLFVDPQGASIGSAVKPLVFYNPTNFHVRWCNGGRVLYNVSTEAQFTQFNRVIRIAQWMDCDAGDAGGCKSLTMAT